MRELYHTLSSMLFAMGFAVTAVASQPLPKVAANGHESSAILRVQSQNASGLQSKLFSTPKLIRNGLVLQREAKVAPPLKAPARTYDAGVDIPKLFGWVNYSDTWTNFDSPSGVYYVPTNNSESYSLRFLNDNRITGGVLKDGIYYCCYTQVYAEYTFIYYEGYDLATVDPQNADRVRYYYSVPVIATAMTHDDATGKIFAITKDPDTPEQYLSTFEFGEAKNDFKVTKIGDLPGSWRTIVSDRSGQLYGIRYYSVPGEMGYDIVTKSELYKIDKSTAEITLIGDTGVKPQFDSDAVIDLNSKRMFWIVGPEQESSYIAEVDLTTGVATPLYTLPDDAIIKGLAIDAPPAYDKAPAAATDAAVHFNEGRLSGTITFKVPSTYYDNTPASGGSLTAKVTANGEPIASQDVNYGQDVEMDISVPSAGMYNFDIILENEEGLSPKTSIEKVFVGKDTPIAPQPVLSCNEGVMTLTWKPVTESVNGGYVNPSEVTYTVVRYPENVTVAENTKETTFTETVSVPETSVVNYYYTVTATYAGLTSAIGESNNVLQGKVYTPFFENFDNGLGFFTVINSNKDYFEWNCQEALSSGRQGQYVRINTYLDVDADDWLLTPPIYLEAGKVYKLKFYVITSFDNDEILEIKMGDGYDIASLTTTVMEPTSMRYGEGGEIECNLVINKTATYTIGFHALSPAYSFYIAVDDVSVSSSISSEVPGPVENFKVVAGENGELSAKISLNAPSKTIDGSALSTIDSVELYRGEELINTFTSVSVGGALSFTDNLPAEGTYTYSAIAVNEFGKSDKVNAEVFVGVGIPKAPQNVKLSRTATDGEAEITWDAVTENTFGQSINPDKVKYDIYITDGYHSTELVKGVTGNSYTYQAVNPGEQAFKQYVLTPVTAAGEGESVVSNICPIGTPYESIHESGQLDYAFTISGSGAMWVRTSSEELGIPSQDNDRIVYALTGQYIGNSGTLTTGLVNLKMSKPGISFYLYSMGADDTNTMKVSVIDAETETSTEVANIVINTLPDYHAWNKIMIPLDEFAGKTISIKFEGCLNMFTWMLLDNMAVDTLLDYDLAVESLNTPSHAEAGENIDVAATIRNEGMKDIDAYKVQILIGQDVVASCDAKPIVSNTREVYKFTINMPPLASEPVEIVAKVIYDNDQNQGNNIGKVNKIDVKSSHFPAVTDLSANMDNSDARLTWSAPDYSNGVPLKKTEDFETAEGWAHEFGDWQFIDMDQSPVGAIVGFTTPGIDYSITTSSFYVFDTEYEDAAETFTTHSGSKMLVSLFRWDNKMVDDWAVSPKLEGSAQTISFYARSYDAMYPETCEVYYTTSDAKEFNVADYIKCAAYTDISSNFEEYTADIPDGATRFAIRSCAEGAYMFQLDDVAFYPEGITTKVELIGYDIYRDGEKLNDTPVKETAFTDKNVDTKVEHSYVVVALYDKGSSGPSNIANLEMSALNNINANDIVITADHENVIVCGANGELVSVYSVDGRTFYNGIAKDLLKVPVPQGVYIVKANTVVAKVIVK